MRKANCLKYFAKRKDWNGGAAWTEKSHATERVSWPVASHAPVGEKLWKRSH